MEKEDGGSAFPQIETSPNWSPGEEIFSNVFSCGGMSLRDYFAAKAMQTELMTAWERFKNGGIEADSWSEVQHWIAGYAYDMADAMLRARNAK